MDNKTAPLCCDCVHFMPNRKLGPVESIGETHDVCSLVSSYSVVRGEVYYLANSRCSAQRSEPYAVAPTNKDSCGPEGKHFVEKLSHGAV